jgi:hypothetical protein
VVETPEGKWEVAVYKREHHMYDGTYTDEALPEWIRKDVSLLNLVPSTSNIRSIGHRVGPVYWLLPKEGKHESNT